MQRDGDHWLGVLLRPRDAGVAFDGVLDDVRPGARELGEPPSARLFPHVHQCPQSLIQRLGIRK